MIKTISLFLACAACAFAEPTYFGTVLLTDGNSLIPNVAVPTPSEVDNTIAAAEIVYESASMLSSMQGMMKLDVDSLAVSVSALGGQQIVYGTCVSFGSQAIESPTNVTATIIGMTNASNTLDTAYFNLYVYYSDAMSGTGIQTASALNATWEDATALETELTTFDVAGAPVECYRMLVGLPAEAASAFLRATGDVLETVVGQLTILDGLTVNGVAGLTITNSIGIFKYGLLVEPLE